MITFLKNKYYRNRPMVKYWKFSDSTEAYKFRDSDGAVKLRMPGEDHVFPGYPRGSLLFGKLSKLKHEIKNQLFNDLWKMKHEGISTEAITRHTKNTVYPALFELSEGTKYDMVPPESMVVSVRELWRAIEAVDTSDAARKWKEILTFIFQEDDAYRFRFQWLAKFMPRLRKATWEDLDKGLGMMVHAEITSDMKERVNLIRVVLNELLRDPVTRETWDKFIRECDWKKIRLSEGDKYHFRAKFFKVDYPEYQY